MRRNDYYRNLKWIMVLLRNKDQQQKNPWVRSSDDWKNDISSRLQVEKMRFLLRVHVMILRNKVWSWMSSHFSKSRDISVTLVRPCDHNVPGDIGESSPATYTNATVMRRKVCPRSIWCYYISNLSWPGLGVDLWSQQNWDCWKSWGIPRRAAASLTLLRGELIMKMNEYQVT